MRNEPHGLGFSVNPLAGIAPFLAMLFFCALAAARAEENPFGLPDGLYTQVTTERGVVVGQLFYEKTPMTVANYVGLAEGTLGPKPRKPFYEGLKWHRVVPEFVVQGGDPTATGDGGPGYEFPDELVPRLHSDSTGVMLMANDGPDSNGSQYCFMLSPQPHLNYLHTVFGQVVRGLDVLPKIKEGDTMHVKILRLGDAAKAFRADDAAFAKLQAKAIRYKGPKEPGPAAAFDDPDKILPNGEWNRAKTFNFKLGNFERFTGMKLVARVYAKAPAEAKGHVDDWLAGKAAAFGTSRRGAFAVYFADEDRWHLKIGADSAAQFVATGKAAEKTGAAASLSKAEDDFLAMTRAQALELIAKAAAKAEPGKPLDNAGKIKLKVDTVLDGLMLALEPQGN